MPNIDGQMNTVAAVRRTHWCRVVMNQDCDKFVASLVPQDLHCLEISGGDSRWARHGWASFTTTTYPVYDVCAKPLPRVWDVVIAEQVLEHVGHPEAALRNIRSMLREGGVAIITTPFLVKYHPAPRDCYRWTADGLRETLLRCGFSHVRVNAWGNRDCVLADMTPDGCWTWYVPAQHSLQNDPRFPVVIWAFAWK